MKSNTNNPLKNALKTKELQRNYEVNNVDDIVINKMKDHSLNFKG